MLCPLTPTYSVVYLFPQVHSNINYLMLCEEAKRFHYLLCLAAQRKGMVINMETKKYRFDEVTINFDKKRIPLSSAQREKRQGMFRYYGAQGVIDHVDDYIFDGTYLLIAEDGENLKSKKQNIAQVVDGQFWVNNHAHIVQGNEQCDTRFLCYLINSMDLSGYVTGSAQPKLSQANLNAITLSLPTLVEQKRIVEYLYMLDQKIDVNRQINDNLAA